MNTLDAMTRVSVKNILFATDFSSNSDAALPYALAISRQYGAKLYAAYAMNPDAYRFAPDTYALAPIASWRALAEAEEHEAQKRAQQLEERLRGVPHQLIFQEGDVWEVLSDIIQKKQIDLLVIGTHGRTGIQKLLLGSIAEEIFRQAACPVLTVGPNVSAGPDGIVHLHEILYATDFSPESLAAAPYAISLAQEHQAQLALLHVLERPDTSIRNPELTAASLLHGLHELVPPEAELWCHPKCFVKYGPPVGEILELAKVRRADLIVLGVRRPKGQIATATHLAQGTAYKVAAQASCPVLTVRG